jgi:hypothetical protein
MEYYLCKKKKFHTVSNPLKKDFESFTFQVTLAERREGGEVMTNDPPCPKYEERAGEWSA